MSENLSQMNLPIKNESTGETTLKEFRFAGSGSADTQAREMIAPIEPDLTSASQSYAAGKQFSNAGILYKATVAINQGDAIVVGTNCEVSDDITDQIGSNYSPNDPAETDLADADYVPFYDSSATAKKKSLWSNIVDKINAKVADAIYPVGSIYMSINSTMPIALTTGKTWQLLSGDYVLKTISSGTGGQTSNAGNTGSTTLTAAQSGVPAHSHGLNSHTHSVGAHSHGLNSHTHSIPALSGTAASNGAHTHNLQNSHSNYIRNASDESSGYGLGSDSAFQNRVLVYTDQTSKVYSAVSNGAHTHSVTTTKSTTGQASGSTANSSAFNTGAASGNTDNNTAAKASEGHTHTAGMPQNIGVYVWKRTA